MASDSICAGERRVGVDLVERCARPCLLPLLQGLKRPLRPTKLPEGSTVSDE